MFVLIKFNSLNNRAAKMCVLNWAKLRITHTGAVETESITAQISFVSFDFAKQIIVVGSSSLSELYWNIVVRSQFSPCILITCPSPDSQYILQRSSFFLSLPETTTNNEQGPSVESF